MIKNKLPMGQRVSFTAISESRYPHLSDVLGEESDEKEDDRRVYKSPRQGSGIICGVRVLQEGHLKEDTPDFETGYSDPPSWRCTKHVDVYLVAVSYGQIVRVQPEDITAEATP